jgi:hypothetical protein
MVGARIVFTEPSVDESVVRGLVVDPQEKEFSGLEIGLEFERDEFEGNSVERERLWFGCNCSRGRVHLASIIVQRVFIDKRCCC